MEERDIITNGVRLHVVEEGAERGPLLILLHGFPEFWYAWRQQIPLLAKAGFRVWAPDQRGYNLSDRPRGISAYGIDQLVADVMGLIDAAGAKTAYVVGHDWGGVVAWRLAAQHPERVSRLVVINAPHPVVMKRRMRRDPRQMRRSWYVAAFQIPWLPEALFRLGNWRRGVGALVSTSRPGSFSNADLERYREAWSRPGAITGMINWYRAAMRKPGVRLPRRRIAVPTLVIWGARDAFIGRECANDSLALCEDGRLEMIDDGTHWVHHEEPAHVASLIAAFCTQKGATPGESTPPAR